MIRTNNRIIKRYPYLENDDKNGKKYQSVYKTLVIL